VEEAFGAHPVFDGYTRHAVAGEPAAVIKKGRAGDVELEHAAGDPNPSPGAQPPRDQASSVEGQAVLACADQLWKGLGYPWRERHLRRLRSKCERIAHPVPRFNRLCRS
jgi:hypothetical protein